MNDDQQPPSLEEQFRYSLEGVVEVASLLSPHCKTVKELVMMVQHAIDNPAQLRLLMTLAKMKK
jgi:hypothetical protein